MQKRRESSRYLFSVKAKLFDPASGAASDVTLVNISPQGCCAEDLGALAVGEKRVLKINWRGAQIQAEAAAVWNDAQGHSGFKFLSVGPEGQGLLTELCSTLQLQPTVEAPTETE